MFHKTYFFRFRLGFVKYENFHISHGLGSRTACSRKISLRSVEGLQSDCKFSISSMAAVRHLGFLKYANFHLQHGLGSPSCSPTPIYYMINEFWRFSHKYGPNCIFFIIAHAQNGLIATSCQKFDVTIVFPDPNFL